MGHDKTDRPDDTKAGSADNRQLQGEDKAPGEERGKSEGVTQADLKGKKVDGDPSMDQDKPSSS